MKGVLWLTLCLALSVAACDKKKDEKAEEKKPAAAKNLSSADLDKADIPVEEDYELKARTTINEKNVESQLDALEKEISADTK